MQSTSPIWHSCSPLHFSSLGAVENILWVLWVLGSEWEDSGGP